jgi:hypothetical protein
MEERFRLINVDHTGVILYELTPCSRVLPEKPPVAQLLNIPTFNGTQIFITALTRARY